MFSILFDELFDRYNNLVCEQFCKYKELCEKTDTECALSVASQKLLAEVVQEVLCQCSDDGL